MIDYKEIIRDGRLSGYIRISDGATIPISEENRDYLEFQKQQAAGEANVIPADPPFREPPEITQARVTFLDSRAEPGARLDALALLLGISPRTISRAQAPRIR